MAIRSKERIRPVTSMVLAPGSWEMYVEIKVADTGKGISESNQAAIFRRFYREEEVHEQQGVDVYKRQPLSHEDVTIDTRRLDDYELLSAEEILGGEQSF